MKRLFTFIIVLFCIATAAYLYFNSYKTDNITGYYQSSISYTDDDDYDDDDDYNDDDGPEKEPDLVEIDPDIEPWHGWDIEDTGVPTGETTIRWVYEKSDQYGGFRENEEYDEDDMTPGKLEAMFKDISFEIFDDYICYSRDECCWFEEESYCLPGFFSSKLGEKETPEQIRFWFKDFFDVQIGDSVHLYDIKNQTYPFHRMIIFPNKILMFVYGAFYASFVPTEHAETSRIRRYSAGMEWYTITTHPEKTIRDLYPTLRRIDNHLIKELPGEDTSYTCTDHVLVKYIWQTPTNLTLYMGYPGGVTTFELFEEENQTRLIESYSAD